MQRHIGTGHVLILRLPVLGARRRYSQTLALISNIVFIVSNQDAKLLDAVENLGTCWTTIVKSYFPGRTALAAKNR